MKQLLLSTLFFVQILTLPRVSYADGPLLEDGVYINTKLSNCVLRVTSNSSQELEVVYETSLTQYGYSVRTCDREGATIKFQCSDGLCRTAGKKHYYVLRVSNDKKSMDIVGVHVGFFRTREYLDNRYRWLSTTEQIAIIQKNITQLEETLLALEKIKPAVVKECLWDIELRARVFKIDYKRTLLEKSCIHAVVARELSILKLDNSRVGFVLRDLIADTGYVIIHEFTDILVVDRSGLLGWIRYYAGTQKFKIESSEFEFLMPYEFESRLNHYTGDVASIKDFYTEQIGK